VTFTREYIQRSEAGGRPEALARRLTHPIVENTDGCAEVSQCDTESESIRVHRRQRRRGQGIPSVSIGRSKGGNQHSLSEWADVESEKTGAKQMLLILISLAEIK